MQMPSKWEPTSVFVAYCFGLVFDVFPHHLLDDLLIVFDHLKIFLNNIFMTSLDLFEDSFRTS